MLSEQNYVWSLVPFLGQEFVYRFIKNNFEGHFSRGCNNKIGDSVNVKQRTTSGFNLFQTNGIYHKVTCNKVRMFH